MTRHILLIVILPFITCGSLFSQSLKDLISMTSHQKFSQFDNSVRNLSYIFSNSDKGEDGEMIYGYERKYDKGGFVYTDYMAYVDYGDNKPMIKLQSGNEGFVKNILNQLNSHGFKEISVKPSQEKVKIVYENDTHKLFTIATVKKLEGENYNSFLIAVWRK